MTSGKIKHSLLVAIGTGLAICLLAGCRETLTGEIPRDLEEARVTSPNGRLDAVLVREDGGGAAGGWEWYVYVVAKGSAVDERNSHSIFNAGTLRGEKIVWNQQHLLEIRYDIAGINQFRNLWGSDEIHNVGSTGEREYLVEIRLVPSSQDFSLLTPDGGFRPRDKHD